MVQEEIFEWVPNFPDLDNQTVLFGMIKLIFDGSEFEIENYKGTITIYEKDNWGYYYKVKIDDFNLAHLNNKLNNTIKALSKEVGYEEVTKEFVELKNKLNVLFSVINPE